MFSVDEITREVVGHLQRHSEYLLEGLHFGGVEIQPYVDVAPVQQSPVRVCIETVVEAANGQDVDLHILEDSIQAVCELLFTSAYAGDSYDIPPTFWQSPLGQAIMYARRNITGNALVSISEASSILFGRNTQATRMRVQRMISRGELTAYVDPDERNPRKRTRLFRAEVESMRQQDDKN